MASASVTAEIFSAALEVRSEERAAFLLEACGGDERLRKEVEGLLKAHERAGDFMGSPEVKGLGGVPGDFEIGVRIGAYRLEKVLGEGGCGTVYLAEQDPPLRRRVALKVIKPGMDTRQIIARFDLEREALARMEHEHIARVLDAGATESGRPFFVMEYVDGVAVTDFAREKRLGLRERLEIFLDVCRAVKHAHEKGIIHRDIKPANVLVMQRDGRGGGGVVKVIDFGIAKALGATEAPGVTVTQGVQMLGTPEYMSPEQAGGGAGGALEIDGRADVYALGVLLYELLTGTGPVDLEGADFVEMRRRVREVEPTAPSAALLKLSGTLAAGSAEHGRELREMAKAVRGDLDWITKKALEKDRQRRYESVAALMEDVRRYLVDEPIAARRPGTAYRLRKFLRRQRRAVAMVLLAVICVVAGIGLSRLHGREIVVSPVTPPSPSATLVPGLLGHYYAGSLFERLVTERVDGRIDFFWPRQVSPGPGIAAPHYSIKWTGILRMPAGMAEIGVQADDGSRLFIDGVELMQTKRPGLHVFPSAIKAGDHVFELDYWNRIAEGRAVMWWRVGAGNEEIIPADAFFHAEAGPAQTAK